MAKLYQIIGRKVRAFFKGKELPPKVDCYNPLRFKSGDYTSVNTLDYNKLNFKVDNILQYDVVEHNNKFTDYVVKALDLASVETVLKLRCTEDKILLLKLYDDLEYNEGLHNAVKDDSKQFVMDDDKMDNDPSNDTHQEFWRIGDVGVVYNAVVKSLEITGEDEIKVLQSSNLEFWDYSRLVDVDGVQKQEFVFVEMDSVTGRFKIWQGIEISPEKIFNRGK